MERFFSNALLECLAGWNLGEIEHLEEAVKVFLPIRARCGIKHSPMAGRCEFGIELFGEPVHFGAIGGGLLRDQNISAGKSASEAVEHSVGAAEDVVAEVCVGFIEPGCESNPSWNAIDLGYGVAICGEDEVGTNDARNVARYPVVALEGNELWRFSCIEQIGHPSGLATFGALAIELVARF